jgi:hypothetical protein
MKITTLLALFFLVLSFSAFSQSAKDQKVILTPADTSNLFNRLVMALYDRGYTLEQKDDALKFVATSERSIPREAISVKVRGMVKENTVVLYGLFAMEIGPKQSRDFTPIEYRKGKIWSNVHFKELQAIAEAIGGITTYSK